MGHAGGTTLAAPVGTPREGLNHPPWLVVVVLAWLACGGPIPAIVLAVGIDERTVTDGQLHAGGHAKPVQHQDVCQGQIDRGQVPGDALDVKTHAGTLGMALAMRGFARVWVWGAVAPRRHSALLTQVVPHVRAAAQVGQPIVWAIDGCAAWGKAIRSVLRDPVRTGQRGRPPLVLWPDRHSVQVVKQATGRRLTGVQRRLAHGGRQAAAAIMPATHVGLGVINTASRERRHGTWRTGLPALTRRRRTPARQATHRDAALVWTGVVDNGCRVHTTLQGPPAMAADLTDHVWTLDELLRQRVKRE